MYNSKINPSPFAVLLLISLLIQSVGGLIWFPELATGILKTLGQGWSSGLLASLGFGSLVTLWGMFTKPLRGLFLERAGLWSVSGPSFVYGVFGIFEFGTRGMSFHLTLLAIACAGFWRIHQINRAVRSAKEVMRP